MLTQRHAAAQALFFVLASRRRILSAHLASKAKPWFCWFGGGFAGSGCLGQLALSRMPGPQKNLEAFASALRVLVSKAGLTQAQLAEIAGVAQSTVGTWMRRKHVAGNQGNEGEAMLQTREWHRRKRLQAFKAAAAFVMLGGALTLATWDFRGVTATAEQAREIATSGNAEAMSGAAGVLLRETRKNIDALIVIQSQGGASGALATAAIDQLREQIR